MGECGVGDKGFGEFGVGEIGDGVGVLLTGVVGC